MNTKFIIHQIDQASLGLSREYLMLNLAEPFVQAYHNYQVDIAVLFGATQARAEVEMLEALNFEIELAKVNMLCSLGRDLNKIKFEIP